MFRVFLEFTPNKRAKPRAPSSHLYMEGIIKKKPDVSVIENAQRGSTTIKKKKEMTIYFPKKN